MSVHASRKLWRRILRPHWAPFGSRPNGVKILPRKMSEKLVNVVEPNPLLVGVPFK